MIKLLLVEDDEDDYIITRDFLNDLSRQTYQLDWAKNPEQAREYFREAKHDVCLLDYSLGSYTGLQLIAEAYRLGFNSPIIMLTGHDDSELDADALSAGAVDYLVKSQLSADRLGRAIRYAVARKDMEQERVKRIQAQAENRSKSEFLAHLSHELRTPLTAILGYTDLLSHHAESATTHDYVHIIKRNGTYLLSLLNDVLDLSKIEAGKLDINRQPVNLNEILSNIFSLMDIKAREKNITFSIHADQNIPQVIITDATRLQQILINIVGNAIKFTDKGGVTLNLQAEATINAEPDKTDYECSLIFHVRDTGIGLDNHELARLFQPFEQIRSPEPRAEQGTGLGLTISQKLAERLNGHISAASEKGKGSCFSVQLRTVLPGGVEWGPLRIEKQQTSPAVVTQTIQASILIADDIAEIRDLLGHTISRYGAKVDFAHNGLQVLEKVTAARSKGNHYDLILMDMQMPDMDGLEATRQLRAMQFTQPVIALTAQTMLGEKEKCLAAGCNEHLGKPILEQQLIGCIRRHLSSSITKKRKILLIEDNADARHATQLLLEGLGWSVDSCSGTVGALHLLKNTAFDLILTDINLPDGDGITLAKTINTEWTNAPNIVAVSGQEITMDDSSPFTHALLKPLTLDQLASLDDFLR